MRHQSFTAKARDVTFDERQVISGFDFEVVPGTEIVGRLLDPQTQAPIADAVVKLSSLSALQTFFTGTDGSFHGRIMPGKVYTLFWRPPRNRFVVEGRKDGPPTTLQTQADGERFSTELYAFSTLGRLGTLHGQVITADGKPAVRCQVVASTPRYLVGGDWAGNALRRVITDDTGRFALNGFSIGEDFTLNARAENNSAAGILPVRLDGGTLNLRAHVVLQPTTPGGEFLLTDRHGKPRPNLSVEVGPIREGQTYPVQGDILQTDGGGVLRLPFAIRCHVGRLRPYDPRHQCLRRTVVRGRTAGASNIGQ